MSHTLLKAVMFAGVELYGPSHHGSPDVIGRCGAPLVGGLE